MRKGAEYSTYLGVVVSKGWNPQHRQKDDGGKRVGKIEFVVLMSSSPPDEEIVWE